VNQLPRIGSSADGRGQVFGREGFVQHVKCTGPDELLPAFGRGVGCQHKNWQALKRRVVFHLLDQSSPIKIGHPQVCQNDIDCVFLQDIQSFPAIVRRNAFESLIP